MASIMLGRNFYYEIPRVLLRSYTMKLSTMANYDPTVCKEGEGRVWYGRQTHIWRFSLTIYLYRPSTLVRSWPSWYGHGQNRYLYIRTKIPQEKRRYELINRAWNSNMLCCLFRNWCSNQITLTINLASFAQIIMRCLTFYLLEAGLWIGFHVSSDFQVTFKWLSSELPVPNQVELS